MGLDLAPLEISLKLICFVQLQIMKAIVGLTQFQELFPNLLMYTERISHSWNPSWDEPAPPMQKQAVNLCWFQWFPSCSYPVSLVTLDFLTWNKRLAYTLARCLHSRVDVLLKRMDFFKVRAVVERFSTGFLCTFIPSSFPFEVTRNQNLKKTTNPFLFCMAVIGLY